MESLSSPQPQCASTGSFQDQRCVCGALIARLVPGGVELKCKRCKNTMIIPLTESSASRS